MDKTSLGDRMKGYENVSRFELTRRTPVIIRVDGRAFHTFTKQMQYETPFDTSLSLTMQYAASHLMNEIQGAKLAYIQSDEISILVTDYDTLETQPWFGNSLQKVVSVSASIATVAFNRYLVTSLATQRWSNNTGRHFTQLPWAMFDARAFNIPKEEVTNYFIWRQQDCVRNSVQMLARSVFSHKECHKKSVASLQDKLVRAGINWNDVQTRFRHGFCWLKDGLHDEIPLFKVDRDYIESLV